MFGGSLLAGVICDKKTKERKNRRSASRQYTHADMLSAPVITHLEGSGKSPL